MKITKEAAVFVPFCEVNNETSLLFTKRSQKLSKHRGEVSFPGGIRDEKDESITATALRETKEELGLPPSSLPSYSSSFESAWDFAKFWIDDLNGLTPNDFGDFNNDEYNHLRVIGSHHQTLSSSSYGVTPVIGYIANFDMTKLSPNEDEVEVVFTVPLSYLYNDKYSGHKQITSPLPGQSSLRTKYYKVPSHSEIWGLTAYFTDVILKDLKENFSSEEAQYFLSHSYSSSSSSTLNH